jgi:hypothetical protein
MKRAGIGGLDSAALATELSHSCLRSQPLGYFENNGIVRRNGPLCFFAGASRTSVDLPNFDDASTLGSYLRFTNTP